MTKFSLLSESISSSEKGFWRKRDFGMGDGRNRQTLFVFYLVLAFVFFILVAKLFLLTIVDGEKNRILAEGNRIRLISIEAPRGEILDADGQMLAESWEVLKKKKGESEILILKEQADELIRKGLAGEGFEGDEGQILREIERRYSLSKASAHLLGYVSLVQADDLENSKNVSMGANVGRLGVEAVYESFLAGVDGKKLIEVSALGKKVSILGEQAPREGKSIQLSIKSDLQKRAYEALEKGAQKANTKRGAVIISNPENGQIMALASVPSFDPTDVGKSVSDQDKPFLNRAILGTYPPGSVFKIVTAIAGLESGSVNKDTEIEDVGEFSIGEFKFPNWYFLSYGRKEGILKIDRAIARSNDIFFYRIAEKTGLDSIRAMASKFGYGQKTGIDLPDEAFGLVPSVEWKKSAQNEDWFLGDTMHLGIGQGSMIVTPVQVNVVTSFMASGKLMKPYIVTKIGDQPIEPKEVSGMFVKKENFDLVREGMRQACAKGGTGWPFFEAKYTVGCKTGTAERGLGDPHAWFTAFAPFDNPQVAITVIIEDGGEGSSVAGPVAKEILDYYFAK